MFECRRDTKEKFETDKSAKIKLKISVLFDHDIILSHIKKSEFLFY